MAQSVGTPYEIAQWQKYVLYCILGNLACMAVPFLFLIMVPMQLYCVYRLARALGFPGAYVVLYLIGMFLPLVSLLLLLVLSQRATGAIRAAGFSVGFMGANLKEIQASAAECPPLTPPSAQ